MNNTMERTDLSHCSTEDLEKELERRYLEHYAHLDGDAAGKNPGPDRPDSRAPSVPLAIPTPAALAKAAPVPAPELRSTAPVSTSSIFNPWPAVLVIFILTLAAYILFEIASG